MVGAERTTPGPGREGKESPGRTVTVVAFELPAECDPAEPDIAECSAWRVDRALLAPAVDLSNGIERAARVEPDHDVREHAGRRRPLSGSTPANQRPVGAQTARRAFAGRDLGEHAVRHVSLAGGVVTPAAHVAVRRER